MNMAGRFTLRRSVVPEPEIVAEPAPAAPSWMAPVPEAAKDKVPAEPSNPLLSDKLLDAKVRLHRRLIEEINLSALEKLPEDEMRAHVQQSSRSTSWSSGWRSTPRSSTSSSPKSSTK